MNVIAIDVLLVICLFFAITSLILINDSERKTRK